MLDINVKTIDGQSRSYSVPDNYTVKQFKEKIAHSLNIPIERQRLIFQGKELKDVNLLSDFDVNGKTLHLVQRLPPSRTPNNEERTSTSSNASTGSNAGGGPSIFNLGSFEDQNRNTNLPDYVRQLIGGLGEFGQNATVNATNIGDSNNMEVHIDLGNVSQLVNENEIRARIRTVRRFLQMAQSRLNRLDEIQSGAPLEDVPGSTIIVGSIQTTATLTGGSPGSSNPLDPSGHLFTTSIPFSTILQPPAPPTDNNANNNTNNNANNNANNNTNHQQQQQQSQQPENIGVDVLADLIKQVTDAQIRFQPYLQQYHEMLLNDMNEPIESPSSASSSNSTSSILRNNLSSTHNVIVLGDNRRQRFANNINDMMHLLGHLYHNLSDLHINLRDRPPRQMHTMNSMQQSASAIIGAAIPVEASIQIPISMSTTTTTTTTTTSSNNATNAETPTANVTNNQTQQRVTPPPAPTSITDFLRNIQQRSSNPLATSNPHQQTQQQTPIFVNSRPRHQRPTPHFRPPFSPSSPSLNSYDQFLPCNSVHFYNSVGPISSSASAASNQQPQQPPASQRRRHPAGDQQPTNQQRNTNSTQPNSDIPIDISRLISSILSSPLVGGASTGGLGVDDSNVRVNIGGSPGHIQIQRISTHPNNSNSGDSINNPIEFLTSQLFGGGGFNPMANSNINNNNNNTNNSSSNDQSNNITQAIIREAINLMDSSSLSQENEQRLNQPLREFMRLFGDLDDDEEESESSNSTSNQRSSLNILNVFFQSLSLGDMINLARGQQREQVFERSRQPVREYLQQTYSITNTNDIENTNSLIDRLYQDIFLDQNGLNLNLNQFDLINNKVDFGKSFEKLIKFNLRKMLSHLLSTENFNAPNTWSSILFDMFLALLDQLVTLTRACVKNADQQFIQFVTQKLSESVSSRNFLANTPFYNIFDGYIRTKLQQMIQGINLPRSDIESFIVYKQEESSSTAATSLIVDDKKEEPKLTVVADEDDDHFDSASSTLSGNSMDVDQHFAEHKKTLNQEQSASSSNDWTSTVPSDWIPTIRRDIEQQKSELNANSSFSDVYMNGMPSKRRRILTSKNDLLTKNLFKKVLNKTLDQIKLKPNVDKQDLVENTLQQSQLIDQFDDQFESVLNDRLKQDQDYLKLTKDDQQDDMDSSSSNNDHIYNKDRFKFSKKRFK